MSAVKPVEVAESIESDGPDPYLLAEVGNVIEADDVDMDQTKKYDLNHYTQFEFRDDVFMFSQSQEQ